MAWQLMTKSACFAAVILIFSQAADETSFLSDELPPLTHSHTHTDTHTHTGHWHTLIRRMRWSEREKRSLIGNEKVLSPWDLRAIISWCIRRDAGTASLWLDDWPGVTQPDIKLQMIRHSEKGSLPLKRFESVRWESWWVWPFVLYLESLSYQIDNLWIRAVWRSVITYLECLSHLSLCLSVSICLSLVCLSDCLSSISVSGYLPNCVYFPIISQHPSPEYLLLPMDVCCVWTYGAKGRMVCTHTSYKRAHSHVSVLWWCFPFCWHTW